MSMSFQSIVKKYITILLAVVLCISVVGCGKEQKKEEKAVDMKKLQEVVVAADTTLPELKTVTSEDKNAELNFTALSDLDYNLVDSYFYSYAQDGDVQEIAVIALKEEGDVAEMMETLEKHVENRIGTFQDYTPEKVELAEKAVITSEGRYVLFVIAEKSGLIQNAFKDSFQ